MIFPSITSGSWQVIGRRRVFCSTAGGRGVVLSEDRRLWVLRKYWGGERVKSEKISVVLAEVK